LLHNTEIDTETSNGSTLDDAVYNADGDSYETSGDMTVDFGFYNPASLGDKVWSDSNVNGIQDTDEAPIKGVTVYLLDKTGKQKLDTNGTAISTETNATGEYLFTNLVAGNYAVEFNLSTLPSGYVVTFENKGEERLDSDANRTTGVTNSIPLHSGENHRDLDMGVVELGTIRGNVSSENKSTLSSIEGVTIILLDAKGAEVARTLTNSDGNYTFESIFPANYRIKEIQPDGYNDVRENEGGGEADENGTKTEANEIFVHVNAGENDIDNNFVEAVIPTPTSTPVVTPTPTQVPEVISTPIPVNITISGNIYDDGNQDGKVNGEAISNVNDEPLFVMLLDDNGELLAKQKVATDGTYLFTTTDGIQEYQDYCLVLSITEDSTIATLPSNWNNKDGESVDENKDGKACLAVETKNVENINFGINQQPVAHNVERNLEENPGEGTQVAVIDLNVTDKEDKIPTTVTILTLPKEGVLYYKNEKIKVEKTINNFKNDLLTVNPKNGDIVIVFTYSTTDITGWESEVARVRMPFSNVEPINGFNIQDDSIEANATSPETRIPVLSNDQVSDGSEILLINTKNGVILWNEGTALGGSSTETTNRIVVEGEGVWEVVDNEIVFTAEDGFNGTPTPIYYVVLDQHGNQSNVAEVSIFTNCYCEPYVESASNSISIFDTKWILLLLVLSSIMALSLLRKARV